MSEGAEPLNMQMPVNPALLEEVRALGPEQARAELARLARHIEQNELRQDDRRARRRALFIYLVDEIGDQQAAVARLGRVTPMVVSFERGRSVARRAKRETPSV
jgi:hypothetical protein